ncbi:MAG: hypothetical protein LBL46_04120 [Rickettsiales bacterium]|jgi:hypothetical protein|nr:hypothetical protein [Rickettsiales bacterium]
MKKFIAMAMIVLAAGRSPAVDVAGRIFTNCATVCINRELNAPDCQFPDISGLNGQLADLRKELSDIKADHLTAAECGVKTAAAVAAVPACPTCAPATTTATTPSVTTATTPPDAGTTTASTSAVSLECAQRKRVYYGIMKKKTITAGTSVKCDNATFGDPKKGASKKCYVDGIRKADENGGFSMEADGLVMYGLIDVREITSAAEMKCDNKTFEDPAKGASKKCYDWQGNEIADENKSFTPPNPKPTGC